ncbi:MAG: hypothetical protein ACRD1Q_15425 [Vicinamibacterales bacterium]
MKIKCRPPLTLTLVLTLIFGMLGAALAQQQPVTTGAPRAWSVDVTVGSYFVPDDWYMQPTVIANRGRLHLESRYNYEDRESLSVFAGVNLEFGDKVTIALTPMFGVLVGRTDAILPALELDLVWGPIEFYSEAEYIIDVHDRSSSLFYNWSELSVWPTSWLRGGMVTQRVKIRETDREIQRGIFAGVGNSKLRGTLYVFKPGSDDRYAMLAVGLTF